jgi:hypothetical protein
MKFNLFRATKLAERNRLCLRPHVLLAIATVAIVAGVARATIVGFGGSGTDWTLNHGSGADSPFITNNVLTLTNNGLDDHNSAFFNTQQSITTFSASFTYQAGGNLGADGVAFVLQNSPAGPSAVGTANGGGGLGYNVISPSAAVELDIFPYGPPGTGYYTEGNTGSTGGPPYVSTTPVDLTSGHPIGVTLVYDGTTLSEKLLDTVNGNMFTKSYAANVPSDAGGATAFVGFTGATGGATSIQAISDFEFIVGTSSCVGDCDGSGDVRVNELLVMVNIALGSADISACVAGDSNNDGSITINEILAAVNNALTGCVLSSPTTTPTSTPLRPTTVTPTRTSGTTGLVDNGDGTITDRSTGLTWEKKDQAGGVHDWTLTYTWAGKCPDDSLCQPNAAAASTCAAATGTAAGCGQCSTGTCNVDPHRGGAVTTIWDWLTQLNAAHFAGHNDWRIPKTIPPLPEGGSPAAAELETILGAPYPDCLCSQGTCNLPCVLPVFENNCASGCTVDGGGGTQECSCTSGVYWTATTQYQPLDLGQAQIISFWTGQRNFAGSKTSGDTAVRAVRGTLAPVVTPTPTTGATGFVDNGDGTISDNRTGLMWEKKGFAGGIHDVSDTYLWAGHCSGGSSDGSLCQPDADASATCAVATGGAVGCAQCGGTATCEITLAHSTMWQWLNALNAAGLGGHSDWRIPTVGQDGDPAELETIVDTSVAGCGGGLGLACVPAVFATGCTRGCNATGCSCTVANIYWSATTYAANSQDAWFVYFGNGHVVSAAKGNGFNAFYVRAVR